MRDPGAISGQRQSWKIPRWVWGKQVHAVVQAWRSYQNFANGNFLKVEKIRSKKFRFFPIFLKTEYNFSVPSAQFYGGRGRYGLAEKIGDFLETFPPEGAKCFYRVSLKVHWTFSISHQEVPLAPFARRKVAAYRIKISQFGKFLKLEKMKSGPKFNSKKLRFIDPSLRQQKLCRHSPGGDIKFIGQIHRLQLCRVCMASATPDLRLPS